MDMCNCEHESHFDDVPVGNPTPRTNHEYMKVPAGNETAHFVGKICDPCATTHMADYVIKGESQ